MTTYIFVLIFSLLRPVFSDEIKIPVNTSDRNAVNTLQLTEIGEFGLLRKKRPNVPAHYHTGVDIKRPGKNYVNEPVFPCFNGIVISKRSDGPYAQIIIEHDNGKKFWSVYEHVAGITVNLFDEVSPHQPIARFMNTGELNKYGWQFDHFHFEILKVPPIKLKADPKYPERLFAFYTLMCHTKEDLNKYFIDPITFLEHNLN